MGMLDEDSRSSIARRTYDRTLDRYAPRPGALKPEQFLVPLIAAHAPGQRLLDVFCGQGREAAVFAGNGYDVVGIDESPDMVARARAHLDRLGHRATFIEGDFFTVDEDGPFDVVYTSATMYGAFLGEHRRRELLDRCRSALATDGVVVISYYLDDASPGERTVYQLTARTTAVLTGGFRSVEPGDRYFAGVFFRFFTREEIDREVAAAGFEVAQRLMIGRGAELMVLKEA